MPLLQRIVTAGRTVFPRGWAPVLKSAARFSSGLQQYRADVGSQDFLYLDLRYSMCLIYFFHKGLPHERGTEALLRLALKPNDTLIDIGANVGFFTRLASLLVGKYGRVFAFEPLPEAFKLLQLNTRHLENVTAEELAISDCEGNDTFYVRDEGDTSSFHPGASGRPISVCVTTIDDRLSLENLNSVDFIKVDVEGFELNVLRGAKYTIETYQPIVYFEFLPTYAEQLGIRYDQFVKFFHPLGYTLHWINHNVTRREIFSSEVSTYIAALPVRKRHLLLS